MENNNIEHLYMIAAQSLCERLIYGRYIRNNPRKQTELITVLGLTDEEYYYDRNEFLIDKLREQEPLNLVELLELESYRARESDNDYDALRTKMDPKTICSLYQYSFVKMLRKREGNKVELEIANAALQEFIEELEKIYEHRMDNEIDDFVNGAECDADIYLQQQNGLQNSSPVLEI